MNYVDGFVASVPNKQREAFVEHAERLGAIFKEHGAMQVVDAWGDDVPEGKLTSFPMAVKCEPGETVVFGWVTWPSKAVRDAGMKKVFEDPRMQPDKAPMPFDGKRAIFGGFEMVAST